MKQVIDASSEAPSAQKLSGLIGAQLQAYEKIMNEHALTQENQDRLFKKVTEYSDH